MFSFELVQFESFKGSMWWDFESNKCFDVGIVDRAKFYLPDGYTVGSDAVGRKHIYNKSGITCELETIYKAPRRNADGEIYVDWDGAVYMNDMKKRIKLERA